MRGRWRAGYAGLGSGPRWAGSPRAAGSSAARSFLRTFRGTKTWIGVGLRSSLCSLQSGAASIRSRMTPAMPSRAHVDLSPAAVTVTRRTSSWMMRACSPGNSCAQSSVKLCKAAMASASGMSSLSYFRAITCAVASSGVRRTRRTLGHDGILDRSGWQAAAGCRRRRVSRFRMTVHRHVVSIPRRCLSSCW